MKPSEILRSALEDGYMVEVVIGYLILAQLEKEGR